MQTQVRGEVVLGMGDTGDTGDTGFQEILTRGFQYRNFTESDVTRCHPAKSGVQIIEKTRAGFLPGDTGVSPKQRGLEHVSVTLARLVAKKPRKWGWLLSKQLRLFGDRPPRASLMERKLARTRAVDALAREVLGNPDRFEPATVIWAKWRMEVAGRRGQNIGAGPSRRPAAAGGMVSRCG